MYAPPSIVCQGNLNSNAAFVNSRRRGRSNSLLRSQLYTAAASFRQSDYTSGTRKDFTGSKIEVTGASILEGELGDQGDYFVGLCLNVGRPSPQVNHAVQRVQRLFAARHGDSSDSHSSNVVEGDLYWW